MNVSAINRMLAPIKRRVQLILSRGVGHLVNPNAQMQELQIELLSGEVLDGVEHFEPYGYTSNPKPGYEPIAASLAGKRSHTVCIVAADRRYRLKGLAEGEVALYTDEGDTVVLKRGRVVEITTQTLLVKASTKVRFETPLVETTGQVKADGDITDQVPAGGKSMANMRTTYNTHTHPGDSGGTTGTPNQGM